MYAVRSAACNRQSAAWRVNRSHGKRRASGPDVMRSTGIASASATSRTIHLPSPTSFRVPVKDRIW